MLTCPKIEILQLIFRMVAPSDNLQLCSSSHSTSQLTYFMEILLGLLCPHNEKCSSQESETNLESDKHLELEAVPLKDDNAIVFLQPIKLH